MRQQDLFPHMVIQMTAIGEESGALDEMLGKVADFYEEEVDNMVDSMSSLLEPLIMVVIGGLVGSRLVARDRRWAMWVASLSYIIAAPLGAAALITQDITSAYLCTFLMSAAATAAYGPAFAMVQELAPPRLRALASATAIMFAILIGAGLGPVAVGSLSDLSGGGAAGLRVAMLAVLAIAPVTALCYLVSAGKMGAPGTN
jgi:MFS family permease